MINTKPYLTPQQDVRKPANTEEVKGGLEAGGALGGWFCQLSPGLHDQRQCKGPTHGPGAPRKRSTADLQNRKILKGLGDLWHLYN